MTLIVSRAEGSLLTLARVAVGVVPANDAMRLLIGVNEPPPKIGPTARAAIADTLSRGTVLSLAHEGGWLREDEKRLWERQDVPAIAFTGNTVRLLSWLMATPLTENDGPPLVFHGELTPAEDFLVACLLDRLRSVNCDEMLARQIALRSLPLTTLAHAGAMVTDVALDVPPAFDVATLGSWLEGLRLLMTRSWLAVEHARRDIAQPDQLTRIGRAQETVLAKYFEAIDAAGRRDLATFLIDAAVQWFTPNRDPEDATRSMLLDAPLRERTEARRRSASMIRSLSTLRTWDQEHRSVRFIDDGYQLAQRLVADWGRLGEPGFERAARWVTTLDAIPTLRPVELPPA